MFDQFTPTYNLAPTFTYSDSQNHIVATTTSTANFVFAAKNVATGATIGQFDMKT